MTEDRKLRLLELAIKGGASAAMAVSRAREFEGYLGPVIAPSKEAAGNMPAPPRAQLS